MRRTAVNALCVLGVATLPAFPALSARQAPTFSTVSSELVVLPVVVTDGKGRYVADLPQERFSVYDNGRPVPVQFFTAEDTPVTIGLIVDASGSMRGKMGEVVAAAIAFARSSHPEDELFVIRFNDDVQRAVATDRRFLLASDLDAVEATMKSLVPDGQTALYDAVLAGFDHLNEGTRPRRALLIISDGGDTVSRATLDQVVARARGSSAAIYTIGLFDPESMDSNPRVLRTLAETGGGQRHLPASPGALIQAVRQIARDIRSGYTIGYEPPARDGAFHRVAVRLAPPDKKLTVRTRPGYFAGRAATRQSSGEAGR